MARTNKIMLINLETKEGCLCSRTECGRRVGRSYDSVKRWYDKASDEYVTYKLFKHWLLIFEWEDVKVHKCTDNLILGSFK